MSRYLFFISFITSFFLSSYIAKAYKKYNLSNGVKITAATTVSLPVPAVNAAIGTIKTNSTANVFLLTGFAYITNSVDGTVSVINLATNTIVATIPVNLNPSGVCVTPDGNTIYVANIGSNKVSVINAATNTVVGTISVGVSPGGMSVSPDGSRLYIANSGENTVTVVNTAGNTVIATISVGLTPAALCISPDGSRVYVANSASNNVSVINAVSNAAIATIAVGLLPESVGNFINGGTVCSGTPIAFTITVNPTPQATPIVTPPITAAPVPGTTLIIPNTFTPNGDGINDTWNIQSIENYPNSTVQIFNRNGENLFYSVNYPIPWNGKYNGNNLPVGTYYYVINLNNNSKPISGWVAIIR